MRVFITGGLGQIGSHIAEILLGRGDQVLVMDDLTTGRVEHLVQDDHLTVVIGSIADRALVEQKWRNFSPMLSFIRLHLTKTQTIGIQTHDQLCRWIKYR